MLGHGPLGSLPYSGTPLRAPTFFGVFILEGEPVALNRLINFKAAVGAVLLTGLAVDLLLSIAPSALNRILLVGSTAVRRSGFEMISDFNMVAGDTKTLVVSVKDSKGDPVNITGVAITWKAARSFNKDAVITKTVNSGITISDGPNGQFTVALDPDDTELLKGGYYHEAQMTTDAGIISTVLRGTMKINRALITA